MFFFHFPDISINNYIVVQCGVFGCVGELFVEALRFALVCGGMKLVEFNKIMVC